MNFLSVRMRRAERIIMIEASQQPPNRAQPTSETRTITVLFTRYHDTFSRFLHRRLGHRYTHTSISLNEEPDSFFSFNLKGFCNENFEKFQRHGVDIGNRYDIQVTGEAYEKIRSMIFDLEKRREELRYSFFGVFMCMVKIPMRRKRRYFCSQFVADMLKRSDAVRLSKRSSLYMPDQLRRELERLLMPWRAVTLS